MPPGKVKPAGDPLLTPAARRFVNDQGNAVVEGFPPGKNAAFSGQAIATANEPGLGVNPDPGNEGV